MAREPTVDDCFARVDQSKIYPPFLARLRSVLQACLDRGAVYVVLEGYRSMDRSTALFTLYKTGKGNRAAPAGYSGHNFGVAADIFRNLDYAPNVLPGRASWKASDLEILYEESTKAGLLDGRSYGDGDHFECPSYVSGQGLAALRMVWQDAGTPSDPSDYLPAVWDYLDAHTPWP